MLSKKSGFTLIELLVVIAIIAILAAILFPVFARAKAKANAASCLSNVKQLTLACIMYASDWHQTLPRYLNPDGWTVLGVPIAPYKDVWTVINPYVRNTDIMQCPTHRGAVDLSLLSDVVDLTWMSSSYYYDPMCWGTVLGKHSDRGYSGSVAEYQAADLRVIYDAEGIAPDTVACADVCGGTTYWDAGGWAYHKGDRPSWRPAPLTGTGYAGPLPGDPAIEKALRHNEGLNVGWGDGHAKWQRYTGWNCERPQ